MTQPLPFGTDVTHYPDGRPLDAVAHRKRGARGRKEEGAAEPPRNSVSQHGSQNLGTPLHTRGDDDEESCGKKKQKQPKHGTKKPQAGRWPTKRLKKGRNVTHSHSASQCKRLMCVFSEIRVVPYFRGFKGCYEVYSIRTHSKAVFKTESRNGKRVCNFKTILLI